MKNSLDLPPLPSREQVKDVGWFYWGKSLIEIGLSPMAPYPKIGSMFVISGLGTSGNSAGFAPAYFYNQTETIRGEAKEWRAEHFSEYFPKPILLFCCLMVGWPLVKQIWRWNYKPDTISSHRASDSRSNAANYVAPSEVGDVEFSIPKCKSVSVTKLQSSVDILGHRCSNELVRLIPIMQFDGCTAPPHSVSYVNGHPCLEMCDICADLYNLHVRSAKCFDPECPDADFQSCVGNATQLEFFAHMEKRVNAAKVIVDQPAVGSTEHEMHPLSNPAHLLLSGR